MFEFHISRYSREKYKFDDTLFSTTGNVIFANFYAARVFAEKMNRIRDAARRPELAVKASDINAMGLIDEVLHYMIELYRRQVKPNVMAEAYSWIESKLPNADSAIGLFVELFPPIDVYRGKLTVKEYLKGSTNGISNIHITLEEMLLLYIANINPAFEPYKELFDDKKLREETPYIEVITNLEEFFKTQPPFGQFGLTLIELLLSPIKAAPYSLYDQLVYIRTHWGHLIADLLIRILGGLDFIKEEFKGHYHGPGPALVMRFGLKDYEEIERFSPDENWMPHLVLMAKSIYVWLHQLSKKYGRAITKLDQIPDEELLILARWGFTGLWLIGIWERSTASRRIKQLTGNPEAASSAYSLYDYTIAWDLGGEEAFNNLKSRAWRFGIRMATDMVPNHMGIYSKWVIEHPERFLQLDYSPYPSYSFTGPNLSEDGRVEIFIEDGYWNRRDAAVVFKRVDRYTGSVRYIYHGNDGTSMPWNDTAQLNHLLPEVREAVIRTTIEVAKRFPIIRFDAAMTLAKRHFQRLWYPIAGYGGDIPSRSEHSISQAEFERLFPVEFWRELVDRIAVEAPNTLLLAEAFWLMEGYFVRTLGMHRVYNSAFMNMLKTEENSKYRDVIKNILKFNPEILRRFVNFMNNPDEAPAVDQFGKDDKYFGVATMMVTMPGLPMFGHGQIEGFSEKYGMEYTRSYWDEKVDEHLVWRHEHEIFPLLKKRHLFSGVDNFVFYDFVTDHGHVNEDVFAYSNINGDERALVVYNNRYSQTSGWIRRSVGMNLERGGKRHLTHLSLSQGLRLKGEHSLYYIFRDQRTGLEFIRQGHDLVRNGLFVHLEAFKSNVFLDFREIHDPDGQVNRLCNNLNGKGVPDIMFALHELYLERILKPFKELVDPSALRQIVKDGYSTGHVPSEFKTKVSTFLKEALDYVHGQGEILIITENICRFFEVIVNLIQRKDIFGEELTDAIEYLFSRVPDEVTDDLAWWRISLIWDIVARLGQIVSTKEVAVNSRSFIDEWLLYKSIVDSFTVLGISENAARYELLLIKILTSHQFFDESIYTGIFKEKLKDILNEAEVRDYLLVNEYDKKFWFNKEAMESLIYWLYSISALKAIALYGYDVGLLRLCVKENFAVAQQLMEICHQSGYDIDRFISLVEES